MDAVTDHETVLRSALATYREAVEPVTTEGVAGLLLTGSLPTGFVDEHSDVDLTLLFSGDRAAGTREDLGDRLVPEGATVQRADAGEKYSFDWRGTHFDLFCASLPALRDRELTPETRWEYDTAEVLADPTGRVETFLEEALALPRSERAALVGDHSERFHWTAQWDVHKWCVRDRPLSAHHLLSSVLGDLLALCYLRDGEFVPREKWLVRLLETLPSTDAATTRRVAAATRVDELDTADVRRRVRAAKCLWDDLLADLDTAGLVDAAGLAWENDEILRE